MIGRLGIKLAPGPVIFPFPSLSLRGYLISESASMSLCPVSTSVSFVSMSLFLSLSPFVCLSFSVYVVTIPVYFCVRMCLPFLSFFPGPYSSVFHSVCLSLCLLLLLFPLCLSPIYLCLLGSLSLSLSVCVSFSVTLYLSIVSVSLYVHLSVYL